MDQFHERGIMRGFSDGGGPAIGEPMPEGLIMSQYEEHLSELNDGHHVYINGGEVGLVLLPGRTTPESGDSPIVTGLIVNVVGRMDGLHPDQVIDRFIRRQTEKSTV